MVLPLMSLRAALRHVLRGCALMVCPLGLAQTNTFPTSGNVGIGTTSPDASLRVDVAANKEVRVAPAASSAIADFLVGGAGLLFSRGHDGADDIAAVFQYSDGGYNRFALATRDDLVFAAGGSATYSSAPERMRITSSGNVGIGTDTPGARLEVVGSLKITRAGLNSFTANVSGLLDGTGSGDLLWDTAQSDGGFGWRVNGGNTLAMGITEAGNVGIGVANPAYKLSVNGTVRAKEIIVETGWADFVFAPDYRLAPLSEVEAHIRENRHLPGLPSEATVATEGVSLGEMQKLLLQKIEELTLHVISQEKSLREQAALTRKLEAVIARLRSE